LWYQKRKERTTKEPRKEVLRETLVLQRKSKSGSGREYSTHQNEKRGKPAVLEREDAQDKGGLAKGINPNFSFT